VGIEQFEALPTSAVSQKSQSANERASVGQLDDAGSGCVKIEIRPLSEIFPFEKNARKIPQRAIDKVAASLLEYGWQQPIVVDKHGVIVAGHVRRLGALQLGWTEAPVHVADKLTPAQIRAYRLMDNRSNGEATFDLDLLGPELAELSALSFDLSLTGFSVHELDVLLRNPLNEERADDAPPLPEIAATQPGDLWLCREHRVLCGDATSTEAVARLLGERKPRVMTTDPPYGISLDSEWRDRAGLNGHGAAEPSYMKTRTKGHTETTISGDTRADWSEAYELVPSLEVLYCWHASIYTREVLNGLLRIGFLYPQQIIWDKGRTVLTRTHYWYQHEPCWYVRKKNAPWFGKAGENATIWQSPSPKFIMGGSDEAKFDHPTQKPVDLMRRPILNHTKRRELVYDPFLGSGTTLAAAELTERTCLAIELDPKYVDVTILRWQGLTGQQATLDGDGRTFEQIKAERVGVAA
jgi:DNA modification methylase